MRTSVSSSCHSGGELMDLSVLSQASRSISAIPRNGLTDGKENSKLPGSHPAVSSADFPGPSGISLRSLLIFLPPSDLIPARQTAFPHLCAESLSRVTYIFFLTEWIIFPSLDIYSNYHQAWCSQWLWLSITNTELGGEEGMVVGIFSQYLSQQFNKLMEIRSLIFFFFSNEFHLRDLQTLSTKWPYGYW